MPKETPIDVIAHDISFAELKDNLEKEKSLAQLEKSSKVVTSLTSPASRGVEDLVKNGVPTSSLEVALIARKYVRSVLKILFQIARDKNMSPSARVQAAKEILSRALTEKSAIDSIDDERLKAMTMALVAHQQAEDAKLRAAREAQTIEAVPTWAASHASPDAAAHDETGEDVEDSE